MKRNERGYRIGEDHPLARISDALVAHLRMLHDAGLGYRKLAAQFDLNVWTVKRICDYTRRAQTPHLSPLERGCRSESGTRKR